MSNVIYFAPKSAMSNYSNRLKTFVDNLVDTGAGLFEYTTDEGYDDGINFVVPTGTGIGSYGPGFRRQAATISQIWKNGVPEENSQPLEFIGSSSTLTTVRNRTQLNIKDTGYINVKDPPFNAMGDGVTDDSAAFAAVSDYVNSSDTFVTIAFGTGHYIYSSGLIFTKPCHLVGSGHATLDYRGREKALQIGPDGVTDLTFASQRGYEIRGLRFTGGLTMSHGIYLNDHITDPKIVGCQFIDFGNTRAWAVFGQVHNWDLSLLDCVWSTTASRGVGANWIKTNGFALDGTPDYGNSQLRMVHCHALHQSGSGTGVFINGARSQIVHCNLNTFYPIIRVGYWGHWSRIIDNYFEVATGNNGCIEFGDDVNLDATIDGLIVHGNYCNLHNIDVPANADCRLLSPTQSLAKLQNAHITDNLVSNVTPGSEFVRLNNIAGQGGNEAMNNRAIGLNPYTGDATIIPGLLITHTAGNLLESWRTDDVPAITGTRLGSSAMTSILSGLAASGTVLDQTNIWLPSDVSNLVAWYSTQIDRHPTCVTTFEGKVSSWNDLSGNNHHATQSVSASKPSWSWDGTRWTVVFDGLTSYLKTAAFTLNQPTWVVIAAKWQDSLATASSIIDGYTAGTMYITQNYLLNPNKRCLYAGGFSDEISYTSNSWAIFDALFSNTNSYLAVNGGSTSISTAGASNAGGLTIGAAANGGNLTPCSIFGLAIYSSAPSAADRLKLLQYFNEAGSFEISL